MYYSIGQIAAQLGVPASTLRYYDKEGLLPFVERSETGRRIFKDVDYQFLQIIECLKATGMELKEIKKFIYMVKEGDQTIDARLQLFKQQRTKVQSQIQELQETLAVINFKCWYYETAKKAGTTQTVDDMKIQDMPLTLQSTCKKLRARIKIKEEKSA